MTKINGRLCRHCLNKQLGTKLSARDCIHNISSCSACGGAFSYYTVTGVTVLGKLKMLGKTV